MTSMPSAAIRSAAAPLWLVGAALVVLTAIGPWAHHRFGGYAHYVVFAGTAAGALWAMRASTEIDRRSALIAIAAIAVLMRLPQLLLEPYLSDDIYRYVWDGRVQAAGINPYRYIPSAPELAHLRDPTIYPLINRPDYAPTIYPPVAQMFYLLVTRLGESVLVMKLAFLACEAVTLWATLRLLDRLDLPPTRIVAFAWHPLAIWEIAGSGHIDALMGMMVMLALLLGLAGRTLLAGAVATAGALVKPTSLLLLPVLWRPFRPALPAVFVATIAACYLPYLSVGWKVLGFAPGYIAEEGLDKGYGFRLVMIAYELFGPIRYLGTIYLVVFAAIMIALAVLASFRRDRSPPATVAATAILFTAFLVLLTPHYPWYYLVLLPFLAVYPWSWTLWALTVGGVLSYDHIPHDVLPLYVWRQAAFNAVVILSLVRDVRLCLPELRAGWLRQRVETTTP